jgi:pyruvate oxidase
MLMADFTTAVREDLNITSVVFNDGYLKNIRKEQERDGYPVFGVEFPNPNFAEFATSAGGYGIRVTEPKELDEAFQAAFESKKPSLIDVIVDPTRMAAATKRIERREK